MPDPAEETVAAPPPNPAAPAESATDPPPADAASPEKVSPPAPAPETRSREFRLLGEDTSVHKALGGGKSKELFLLLFPNSSLLLMLQFHRWGFCLLSFFLVQFHVLNESHARSVDELDWLLNHSISFAKIYSHQFVQVIWCANIYIEIITVAQKKKITSEI